MNGSTLPAPRWLTFDCYGTLIDWESGVRNAFREVARVRPDEEEELFTVWERLQWERIRKPYAPYAEILQASFREAIEEFGYRYAAHTGEALLNSMAHWRTFPDVNPALTALSRCYKLAIISNVDRELLGWTLRHFAVRFDALITSEDARAYKPDPSIFQYALIRLNCGPKDLVHVAFGSEYDLRPAGALGFRLLYLNRKQLPAPAGVSLEAEIQGMDEIAGLWTNPGDDRNRAARGASCAPRTTDRATGRRRPARPGASS